MDLRDQPWCCYALYLSFLNPPAFLYDSLLGYTLYKSVLSTPADQMIVAPSTAFATFLLWLLFSKTVKLWPHFYRHPDQMKFIPVLVLFGYLHGLLKLYCLLTLHQVSESARTRAAVLTQLLLRPHGAADDSGGLRNKLLAVPP